MSRHIHKCHKYVHIGNIFDNDFTGLSEALRHVRQTTYGHLDTSTQKLEMWLHGLDQQVLVKNRHQNAQIDAAHMQKVNVCGEGSCGQSSQAASLSFVQVMSESRTKTKLFNTTSVHSGRLDSRTLYTVGDYGRLYSHTRDPAERPDQQKNTQGKSRQKKQKPQGFLRRRQGARPKLEPFLSNR